MRGWKKAVQSAAARAGFDIASSMETMGNRQLRSALGDQAELVPGGPRRSTNFDALRLLAAIAVIYSHSFVITQGRLDAPGMLLNVQYMLGEYAVYTFFIISGYLITQSYYRSSLKSYSCKRILRIFPGLIACTAIVATVGLIAGVVAGNPRAIWEAARYAGKTILLFDTSSLGIAGVVFSDNDFGGILNGSLWSIGPEVLCYVILAAVGVLGVLGLHFAGLGLFVGILTRETEIGGNFGSVAGFFCAGCTLYHWRNRPLLNWKWGSAAVAVLLGAVLLGYPAIGYATAGSYLVIAFGLSRSVQIRGATRFGDLSYGLYLYGWPCEQVVRWSLGSSAVWWLTFALSLPFAALLAYASWHLVERPSLALAHSLGKSGAQPGSARS